MPFLLLHTSSLFQNLSLSLFLSQTLELSCYGKFSPSNCAEIFNMVIPNWSELILRTYRKVMWLRVIFIWFFEYKSKYNALHREGNISDKSSLIVINWGCIIKNILDTFFYVTIIDRFVISSKLWRIIRFAKHSRWLMYKIILLNILFTLLINKQTMHNIRNLIIHHFHIYEVAKREHMKFDEMTMNAYM